VIIMRETKEKATAEYKASVEELLRIAKMRTGGSRVAAQVLLSAYNGYSFHVDVTDLGLLDQETFGHALRVIWGRNQNPWMEPQRVIDNGDVVFGKLWDNWIKLHVQNRWKKVCPDCNGAGRLWPDEDPCRPKACHRCDGRGLIAKVTWPGYDSDDESPD
jgi:hypothetical protein